MLAATALLVVLLLMLFEWNMLRGPIERRVSAATGREFHIYGDLDVELSMKPRVSLGQMSPGNWSFPSGDAKWPTIQQLAVDEGQVV